ARSLPAPAPVRVAPARWADEKTVPPSGLGSAGRRSEEQEQAAVQYVDSLVSSFPPGTVICYTDGSSLANPGHAGCAARVEAGQDVGEVGLALGVASNQIAELSAARMAFRLIDKAEALGMNFAN